MTIQNKAIVIVVLIVLLGIGVFFMTKQDGSEQSRTEQTATSSPTTQPTENNSTANSNTTYTLLQVSEHNKKNDCWTVINDKVYDITSYVPRHPGGDEIVDACGRDGTSLFVSRTTEDGDKIGSGTPHSAGATRQLDQYFIGNLE